MYILRPLCEAFVEIAFPVRYNRNARSLRQNLARPPRSSQPFLRLLLCQGPLCMVSRDWLVAVPHGNISKANKLSAWPASTARTGCTRTPPRKPPRPTGPKPAWPASLGCPEQSRLYPEWPECPGPEPVLRFFGPQLRSKPEQSPQDCAGNGQTRSPHASAHRQVPECTSRDAQQAPDDTKPPFLQAQITKPAHRKTISLTAGQAHHGLPIQSLQIESENPEILNTQKMCASDSRDCRRLVGLS